MAADGGTGAWGTQVGEGFVGVGVAAYVSPVFGRRGGPVEAAS